MYVLLYCNQYFIVYRFVCVANLSYREYLLWRTFLRTKCLRYFLFAGTYFCGSLEKSQNSQKLEPSKISCHTVVKNFRISPWKTSEIFRNDRESSESGRKLLDILKITLLFLEPFFVSFWIKFTVTENFLLLVLKCLKLNCFMLQSQKN